MMDEVPQTLSGKQRKRSHLRRRTRYLQLELDAETVVKSAECRLQEIS
jgi:ribosomal protein L32